MDSDLLLVLAWGVPGCVVWLMGQAVIFREYKATQMRSPLGLRIATLGIAFALLGWFVALELRLLTAGRWPIAIVVLIGLGFPAIAFLLLALRPALLQPRRPGADRSQEP